MCLHVTFRTVSNMPSASNNSDSSAAEESGDERQSKDKPDTADESAYVKYRPHKKRKAMDPVEAELLKMLKETDKEQKDDGVDDDKGFFLSLYNDFRHMNLTTTAKMKIKMDLMQVTNLFIFLLVFVWQIFSLTHTLRVVYGDS